MFRKVCVIEFARIIAAMQRFENPRSESGGKSASRISAKLFVCMPGMSPEIKPSTKPISIEGYQQVEHRVTGGWGDVKKISCDGVNASEQAGIMTHYIADVAVFGYMWGAKTDWGTETYHSDYEGYVQHRTDNYTSAAFDPPFCGFPKSLFTSIQISNDARTEKLHLPIT